MILEKLIVSDTNNKYYIKLSTVTCGISISLYEDKEFNQLLMTDNYCDAEMTGTYPHGKYTHFTKKLVEKYETSNANDISQFKTWSGLCKESN